MSIRRGRRASCLLISAASLMCAAMPADATAQDAVTLLGQERVIKAFATSPGPMQTAERVSLEIGAFSDGVTARSSGSACLSSPFGAGDTTTRALSPGDVTPQACVSGSASGSASQSSLIAMRAGALEVRASGSVGAQAFFGTASASSTLTATFAVDGLAPYLIQGDGLAGSVVLTGPQGAVVDLHPSPSGMAESGVLPAGTYTLVIKAASPFGAFNVRFTAGAAAPAEGPRCTVRMTSPSYTVGDVVAASVVRVENHSATPVFTEMKMWLRLPDGALLPARNEGADGSMVLAGATSQNFGPLDVMGVTADIAPGLWELGCRLLDPVSGQPLYENNDLFEIR